MIFGPGVIVPVNYRIILKDITSIFKINDLRGLISAIAKDGSIWEITKFDSREGKIYDE